jgi:hypothetical protein
MRGSTWTVFGHSSPFSDEHLITVETIDGAISGFIHESELRHEGDEWQVRGKIKRVSPHAFEVGFSVHFSRRTV